MSHYTRIRTRMTDSRFLVKALRDLAQRDDYVCMDPPGDAAEPENAIVTMRIASHSSALQFLNVDGAYEVIADERDIVALRKGGFFERLAQRYAYHATIDSLQTQGFSLIEERLEESGEIRLLLRRAG